jgi:hypothetical protein
MSVSSQVLFWLTPQNPLALKYLHDPANQHYVGPLPGVGGLAFTIMFNYPSQTPGYLITFGRRGDIVLSGSRISRVQMRSCYTQRHEKF